MARSFASVVSCGVTRRFIATFRSFLTAMGSTASTASPRIGPRIWGSKTMPRSGVSPRAKTSPRPAPTHV